MPELPEVETTRLGLLPFTQDKIIKSVTIKYPRLRWPIPKEIQHLLLNQKVLGLKRRAKYLIFEFSVGNLITHLGMSGHFKVTSLDAPWEKHDHFGLCFEDHWCRLHDPRRFGAVLFTKAPWDEHPLLCTLGHEPLERQFTSKALFTLLQKRKIPIKTAIMNQNIVVGVGNIYASEALFKAKIHPLTPANKISLSQADNLVQSIKQILRLAIKSGGTTLRDFKSAKGQLGYFQQQLNVYGKEGQACPVCHNSIKASKINQRSSYYCPSCQIADQ